ncbi:hypothetical protein [Pseudomonas oryzicola]|uniref:Uncharacterized protein n=1 Tax=Pseudomonas oryzicola TaxID=485876 RepID=A0ABS6QBN4_9PSED|nr:hypothetical protein [Pseudomonas oryzicola]MBV4491601.1 hypothetical protein [Pseudomonas oryzicola]
MAMLNFTANDAISGSAAFPSGFLAAPELEKISCSTRQKIHIHPLELIGKTIKVAELVECEVGLFEGDAYQSFITTSTVVAVTLASSEHGFDHSLILIDVDRPECGSYQSDLASLTILEVLS